MRLIRKISVGKDYKNEAMHYSVGQEVYGGHVIESIVEEDHKFTIYIKFIISLFIRIFFNNNTII